MGELALTRGDLAVARMHSEECLALATRTGSRKNPVKGWRLAGDIARAEGDWDSAEGQLRKSLDLAVSLRIFSQASDRPLRYEPSHIGG